MEYKIVQKIIIKFKIKLDIRKTIFYDKFLIDQMAAFRALKYKNYNTFVL